MQETQRHHLASRLAVAAAFCAAILVALGSVVLWGVQAAGAAAPQAGAVTVDKSLLTPNNRNVLLVGEQVAFQIVVQNSGDRPLMYVPQHDDFDNVCLSFRPKADPYESAHSDLAGTIDWTNLVLAAGHYLAPGERFTTTVTFDVVGVSADGFNIATVAGAVDVDGATAPTAADGVTFTCVEPASIGDQVWDDLDGDGVFEAGEPGLQGVVVRLTRPDGSFITATTTVTGVYGFTMLPPGVYTVTVDPATVPAGYVLTTANLPKVVTLTAGLADMTNDFGYQQQADLAIAKSDTPDPVAEGSPLTYTLTVSNLGPANAVNVAVTDTLPAGITFVSAAGSGWACGQAAGVVTCTRGALAAGAVSTIIVGVNVNLGTPGPLTNTAVVSSTTTDPNPANNTATAVTTVDNPAIAIAKTPDYQAVYNGGTAAFTISITNTGDVTLTAVSVADPLAPNCNRSAGSLPDLAPGASTSYACTRSGVAGDFTNVATVTAALRTGGSISANDSAQVDWINPAIAVVKAGPDASWLGATIGYTFTVTNAGDTPLHTIRITDTLCAPVTYLSGDAGGDGVLGLAETWTYTCTYTIPLGGVPDPLINTVQVSGLDVLGGASTASAQWSTDLIFGHIGDFIWLDDGDGVQETHETYGLPNAPIYVTGVDANGASVVITTSSSIGGYYYVHNLLPGVYTVTVPTAVGGFQLTSNRVLTFTVRLGDTDNYDMDFGYSMPTAVQLATFAGVVGRPGVRLDWSVQMISSEDWPRFDVWRQAEGGAWKRLTAEPIGPAWQDGQSAGYIFHDVTAQAEGTYFYRLEGPGGTLLGPWKIRATGSILFLPLLGR